jgi:hypothetical protein
MPWVLARVGRGVRELARPEVADRPGNTWLGMVGPGVKKLGGESSTWTDHTDVRPTMLALLGLADNYQDDGRVVTQILAGRVLPGELRRHRHSVTKLGDVYKQRCVQAAMCTS